MTDPSATRDAISKKTLADFGRERLIALCQSLGVSSHEELFSRLVSPWADRRIGLEPQYRSNVADDEAPYEFSVAFSGGSPEVQFYLEPLGEPPSLSANMQAGRRLLTAVASEMDVPLGRLRELEDLFFPTAPTGSFSIWIGVSLAEGRKPRLKVYLNPQARGATLAPRVVAEAMARLGLAASWSKVNDALSSSRERRDEIAIVSLDLTDADDARLKVYLRHHGATIRDIDAIGSLAAEYYPDDVRVFYAALADGAGPFLRKPLISEAVFTKAHLGGPSSVTFEFPIGAYVTTDEVASRRIVECLKAFDVPHEGYQAAVEAFATRPLVERAGIHAHVTFRRLDHHPRIGVYFASEAYVPTS